MSLCFCHKSTLQILYFASEKKAKAKYLPSFSNKKVEAKKTRIDFAFHENHVKSIVHLSV